MTDDRTRLITLRLPKELINEIDELVLKGKDMSRSELIRTALRHYLYGVTETVLK